MATPPDFTSGAVLTASQMNAVGLWKITPTVSGTGMAIVNDEIIMTDVTDGEIRLVFNSDYRHYRMIFQYNSSTTLGLNMRMLSGTSTVDSGSVYTYAAVGWVSNGTNYTDNGELQTSFPLGGGGSNDGGSAYKIMDFIGPNLAGRTWMQNDGAFEWVTNLLYTRRYACMVDTATQYTGIKFYTSSGNIDGTISVYGYN
jgi:hypothetical protein